MKKKLIRTITAMMLLGMAFTAGRQTGKTAWTDDYCTSPVTITDWNTNGVELSIALSDGSELTAYKSKNVYSVEQCGYIALEQIADVRESNELVYITLLDGNVYTLDKAK